ncbi:MAG: aldo/keto reductase [Robiginitomaculum sp.]|nr:aldo/keto reductase [Robiginitomaculum sp.]MDQ7077323.1 aldo/keto reductase [Robiginitomaculum sp.]
MNKAWQGASGLSRIAFGVAGPHATPLVSPRTSHDLILQAFHGGITAFDTGPAYGAGEAERRLGAAIKQVRRDQVFISTKAGVLENKTRDFSPSSITASLDRSLARLGCDYVDALFMHGPGRAELNDDLAAVLQQEKERGRIGLVGMAGRGPEIKAAIDLGIFDLLMAPCHGALSAVEQQRLEGAKAVGIGIIGIEVLTGASAGLRLPRSAADLWYGARAFRQGMFAKPERSAKEALRHTLNAGLADVVMVSTTRSAHLQEALGVLDETDPNT